jgi:hypothetical protein
VDKGLTHERFEHQELMHQKLASVSKELWGVDTDAEHISFLQKLGFENLLVGDVCELDKIEALKERNFDVIVATEVIEHLDSPGLFLQAVRSLMVPQKTHFIVSVPNAFRIDTLLWLLRGVEYIHPDHNYWFSYLTITNLLKKNGFKIEEIYVYSFQPNGVLPARIRRLLNKRGLIKNGTNRVSPLSLSLTSPESNFLGRTVRYARTLPRRILVSMLYAKTPFWGDGIILIALRNANDD